MTLYQKACRQTDQKTRQAQPRQAEKTERTRAIKLSAMQNAAKSRFLALD
jgi:hypothetical protein